MSITRIEKIGESAVLFLTDEMLKLSGINFGDEVEVSAEKDRKLIVRSMFESERKHLIDKATDNILRHRKNVYQKLAQGVLEE